MRDNQIKKIGKILKSSKKAFIVSHTNPDGDAAGSSLGLYWYLVKKGIAPMLAMPNALPHFLKWLPGTENILNFYKYKTKIAEEISSADIIFCLDFNELNRAGNMEHLIRQSKAKKVLIDHHPGPEDCTDFVLSDPKASSTAELIFSMISHLNDLDLIDQQIAVCLFTGIMTDTGCFNYGSSQPGTYRVVAELLKRGIDKDAIYQKVYNNFSPDRMRLLGYCLHRKLVVLPEYNTAYITLTQEEIKQFGHVKGDTEGFVNYPFAIKNIKVTAFFVEKENHINISFRSRGNFRINEFSRKHFNGGGHDNAAGGESFSSLDETVKKFVKLLPEYSEEIK